MNPKIWGPHAWIFLHTITLNYPENPTPEQKKYYKDFFESLIHVIPCDKCRYNYSKKILKYPINVESRMKLVEWLLFIHNDVNKSNGEKEMSMSEFFKIYREMYSNNGKKENVSKKEYIEVRKEYINFAILFIILLIIYSFFKKK